MNFPFSFCMICLKILSFWMLLNLLMTVGPLINHSFEILLVVLEVWDSLSWGRRFWAYSLDSFLFEDTRNVMCHNSGREVFSLVEVLAIACFIMVNQISPECCHWACSLFFFCLFYSSFLDLGSPEWFASSELSLHMFKFLAWSLVILLSGVEI